MAGKLNSYAKITGLFLRNSRLSTLTLAALVFWGLLGYAQMPKQYNPDIVAPAFLIRVDAPGSNAREVYELITKPLENVVNEIPGVDETFGRSVTGGASFVTVRFFVGRDLEDSMILLRQKLATNLDLKPVGVSEPVIKSVDPEDLPVITLALTSEKYTPSELRRMAFALKDRLKHVPGSSIINVAGGLRRELQLELDAQAVEASKTGLREIHSVLDNTNLLADVGVMKGSRHYTPVQLEGHVDTVEELQKLVITSNIGYDLTAEQLGNVGIQTAEREAILSWHRPDTRIADAVFISIAKKQGANLLQLSRDLQSTLSELRLDPQFAEVSITVTRDEGQVAQKEIHDLMTSLIQAVAIVFAVLFLFLSYRAASIVALSIPLTLLAVFGLGWLTGYSINRITLFALILSLGLLVDSATVVVENIVRHKRIAPEKPLQALIPNAVGEVGTGLMLSTLTTVLAFLPMRFVTGMMGPYMGPIPFFVPAALTFGLLLAYTLNPWMASLVCNTKSVSANNAFTAWISLPMHRFMSGYERFLEQLLLNARRRVGVILTAGVLVLLAVSLVLFGFVRFRMLPKADRNQIYVYLDLAEGSALEHTDGIAQKVSQKLIHQPDVLSVQSFVGTAPILDFNGLFKGADARNGTHQATLRVNLTPAEQRNIQSEELAVRYRKMIAEELSEFPDAAFQMIEDPPGPPVPATFQLKIKTNDPSLLRRVTEDILQKLPSVTGLVDLDTSLESPSNRWIVSVNRRKAAMARISTADIAETLRIFYSGARIGVLHESGNPEQEYITLRFPRDQRASPDGLANLTLDNELGNPLPISDFISLNQAPAEESIVSDNRRRTAYINGEMENRSAAYAAWDVWKLLKDYRLPEENGQRVFGNLFRHEYRTADGQPVLIELDGEWKLTLEVFRDLGMAMIVAIFLIYFVLVVQFHSYRVPLYILGTLPLALIGILPGFALLFAWKNIYFSATSMIGMIALAGIVVNNAIILMETINDLRRRSRKPALYIVIVACKARFRPIVLTSLTTVLGTLMIANDPVWSGLAWSVVFGLSFSAVLTLIFFPVLLYQFHRNSLELNSA